MSRPARKLLHPLAFIALAASAGCTEFTRVFRRIVGETPYAWRRTRCGEIEDRATEPSSRLSVV
jgi:hypothetical protein